MKSNQKLSQEFFEWVLYYSEVHNHCNEGMEEYKLLLMLHGCMDIKAVERKGGGVGGRGRKGKRKGGGALSTFSIATSLNTRLDSPKLGSSL